MIVGGYAVAFHGFPRFTKDIDIFFEPTPENIHKIIQAMTEFGFSDKDLDDALFSAKGNIVTFGVAPVRVDFLNEIDGVDFQDAKAGRIRGKYGDANVFFISKDDLLKNKRATPRLKDKIDVEELA
jgi:hypothetical protein